MTPIHAMTLHATWTKLTESEMLRRSSVCGSVFDSTLLVFGGELEPRKPRDNHVLKVDIGTHASATVDKVTAGSAAPSQRVGATTTTLNGRVYMFSGRGGEAMAPIEEAGRLWVLEPSKGSWTLLSHTSDVYPPARSYHCMTSNGIDTIYIHAGCPEKGRLSDLWAFNVHDLCWKQLAAAPDPPRGGPSMARVNGKLYRMNGFDGTMEQGGSLDIYDLATDSWSAHAFAADGVSGPGARSVATLLPVRTGDRTYLCTLFGESDPSSLGHQGAGNMLSDAWAYSLETGLWSQILFNSSECPQGRGWFDADVAHMNGKDGIVVVGGLGESNERLGDVWLLSF